LAAAQSGIDFGINLELKDAEMVPILGRFAS
jgi:hypothetical protein